MPSALASQLAKGVSLNAPLLSETARKKHFASSSYLFSSSTKGQIDDLHSIHALAINALSQLKHIFPGIAAFDEHSTVFRALFSQRAIDSDRTLLAKEDLVEVNTAIKSCLVALGPCLLENSTGRIVEWLVRRFRVNEFNMPDVLALFLPYHESPHFTKMVSILTIDETAPWSFLAAYKASGKTVHRSVLVTEMLRDRELARFVVTLLPETLATSGGMNTHRTLICFNTAISLEYITRAERRDLDAGALAFLLPALTEPLKVGELNISQALRKDGVLGSYVLLAALSQKCQFTPPAVKTIVTGMVHCAATTSTVGAHQLLTALISFVGAQSLVDVVPSAVVDEIFDMPDILDALKASLEWSGAPKLFIPILGRLVDNTSNEKYAAALELLVMSKRTPESITKHLVKTVLLKGEGSELLTTLYQRYPQILRAGADELGVEDEDRKLELEKTVMNLAMPGSSGKAPQDVILASSNADSSVRSGSIKRIAQILADDAENSSLALVERETLQESLLSRVYDSSAAVLSTLYSPPSASILTGLLASSLDTLSSVAASFAEQNLPRAVLRAHLDFFCNDFVEAHPEHSVRVAQSFVFPNALFSKPRGKTAKGVWEVVASSRLAESALFKGTSVIVERGGEDMGDMNDALVKRLAENFKVSDDYPELLSWLLSKVSLSETDAHTRLFALLISRALLATLSGVDHINAALKTVRAIIAANEELGDVWRVGEDGDEVDEDGIMRGVVIKPSSRATAQRLVRGIFKDVATTPVPMQGQIEWFAPDNSYNGDSIGIRYLYLQRTIYTLTNALVSHPTFISQTNQALFTSLGPNTLLFLSGIWTSVPANNSIGVNHDIKQYVALRHASAFLRAQEPTDGDRPVDFQVIIPSLIVALQAEDRRVRAAAMECICNLTALGAEKKPGNVYAYDQIYGPASAGLQYLDWADEVRYLQLLLEYREHIVNNAEHLVLLHYEHLSRSKAGNRKEAKQRQRILCFLLSHSVCCPIPAARMAILKGVRRVSDSVKLTILLPFIEDGLNSTSSDVDANDKEAEIHAMALEVFDSSAAKELNVDESGAWPVLIRALEHYHRVGTATTQWSSLCATLRDSFSSLSAKRQLELCLKLIELGSTMDSETEIKRLLSHCVKQPALINALLQALQPNVTESGERASKRAKTDGLTIDVESTSLSQLVFLAEAISSQKLSGSLELVSGLLDTLSRAVASSTPAQTDLVYVEQLLMTCLESAASEIKELPNLAPSAVRLDILVELMRTSENPQTFHQALLLMASLARLSPASALHNVMPIFTFMGSNVFHRDDSYSFKVIQKTTESIVPVATASLKEKYNNTLDLHIGSRELLRTFTDAFTHIPRHRRTSFFTHLIDVLNPADYLAPVLMLLADKSSNRVSRQDKQEAQNSLALPLSVILHYSPKTELFAIKEVIREVRRLVGTVKKPASTEKVFLDIVASEDQALSSSILRKRQCQTLLIFIGLGMKQLDASRLARTPGDDMQYIISVLMELASLDQSEQANADLREVGSSAQWALLQAMSVISTSYFSSTILEMLSSQNRKIYQGAFELLANRVPQMKIEAREENSPIMAQILVRMKEIMPSFQDVATITDSMKALLSIGSSSCSKEESALAGMVPIVIQTVKVHPSVGQAIAVIPVLTTRIGPRIIPYLRSLIDTCVSLIKSPDKTLSNESTTDGLQALASLLKAIPTFWGTQEVRYMVDLYLDEELAMSKGITSQLEKLVKLLAKQLPSKVLLSSLLQCWPSVEELGHANGPNKFSRFFELLKRCLHFAARSDVSENLRGLFGHFLQAFDVRSVLSLEDALTLEDKIIEAYLEVVVKLNETAFQPLFRKTCDWAFGGDSSVARQTTFCRLYSALLDLFKELMTPYMSLLVNNYADLLSSFQKEESTDKDLWFSTVESLSKSFVADDGVYWRDEKLRLVSGPLIQQVPVCVDLKINSGKTILSECLGALIDCLEDDSSIKAANLAVLMHTRSEDARVRIFALQCAVAIWQTNGVKLRGLGSETATFIMECAEDENDDVVRACRQLKDAVEAEVGKIDGL